MILHSPNWREVGSGSSPLGDLAHDVASEFSPLAVGLNV